ncbi:hypothetical protein D9M68_716530 [compost metagenome]
MRGRQRQRPLAAFIGAPAHEPGQAVGRDPAGQRAQRRFTRYPLGGATHLPVIVHVVGGAQAQARLDAMAVVVRGDLAFDGEVAAAPLRAGAHPAVGAAAFLEVAGRIAAAAEDAPVVVQRL